MTLTNEQLIKAIRNANTLEDLQHMVEPSKEEIELNRLRLTSLDTYYDKYGSDPNDWPSHAKNLLEEQRQFEKRYM